MNECQENRPSVSEDQKKKQHLDLPVLTDARWMWTRTKENNLVNSYISLFEICNLQENSWKLD